MVERLLVDLTRLLRIEQQRLDLRREHEALVVHRVIERLDADAVAHEPELSCARVPEREGEHATHPVQAVDTPLLEGVHEHLRVGVVGTEHVTADPLELRAHLGVVVDLAVVDELEAAVLVGDRLVSRMRQVDDREPARAETDAGVG